MLRRSGTIYDKEQHFRMINGCLLFRHVFRVSFVLDHLGGILFFLLSAPVMEHKSRALFTGSTLEQRNSYKAFEILLRGETVE